MSFENRGYQIETATKWYEAIKQEGCYPVVAVPTAGGKTVIMALLIGLYLKDNPDHDITILSHTKYILKQDRDALQRMFPTMTIGMYSAGLGEKQKEQVTIAGIQSAINNPDIFRWTNLFIVDEVHAVNAKAIGSYRKLLDSALGSKAGMSATVFRTGHGYIYKGKQALFNTLAHDLTSTDNFNKLTDDGYLSELISVSPEMQLRSHDVKKSAGDYNIRALSNKHDRPTITKTAVQELMTYGKNYKSWLVFAIDIDHADSIHKRLVISGVKSAVLHSRCLGDKDDIVQRFKDRKVQALVSVGMVTTGFDAPNVDLICILRPTLSPVLHVQMVGRGLRIAPGKKHCLVLDFCGNTMRLGPINDVMIPKEMKDGRPSTGAPVKTCPKCRTMTYPSNDTCKVCGHQFIIRSRLSTIDTTPVVTKVEEPKPDFKWLEVQNAVYSKHVKRGGYDSLKVSYLCGVQVFTEWLCLNHPVGTWAKRKADHVVGRRGYSGTLTVDSVLIQSKSLKVPAKILVDFTARYPKIEQTIL